MTVTRVRVCLCCGAKFHSPPTLPANVHTCEVCTEETEEEAAQATELEELGNDEGEFVNRLARWIRDLEAV